MEITNPHEREFAGLLRVRGKNFIPHPLVRLDGFKITPDFYCCKDGTYYEVIGTRQAFHARKQKLNKQSTPD